MRGLIGKKLGMTQVFDDQGVQVPVTVLQVGPCPVIQRKTREADGYDAIQVGFGEQKESRLSKAAKGRFKKANTGNARVLREIRLEQGDEAKPGDLLTVSIFEGVTHVDVVGLSKGRGFQGVVRRHGMVGGRASHGSMMHRRGGAIGNRTWPARVFKNKRMPGHMGSVRVTTQNLKVVAVRNEDNVLLVRGAVPGRCGAMVLVRKAVKKSSKAAGKS